MPPLYADDLSGLAHALVVLPTLDPVADHGRRYAERLRAAGTPARLTEYPGATHTFLSMPGLVPQAKAARAEIARSSETTSPGDEDRPSGAPIASSSWTAAGSWRRAPTTSCCAAADATPVSSK
ncbi:hypothetical protein Acor_59700 [Acrocarpospora corrugata]|uniref:Alpha/beta hydrolase fold-3 domain-containing protein n=1 Tax=Acrocarpospora corrugata TaxID=35763 RepID=A0A5M3W550_9ACTN|nr:hypothetical protein Acor_59700 [Acrocarpospora corrugata]